MSLLQLSGQTEKFPQPAWIHRLITDSQLQLKIHHRAAKVRIFQSNNMNCGLTPGINKGLCEGQSGEIRFLLLLKRCKH